MNKLQRYNQKLLAIIATLFLLFVGAGLAIGAINLITSFIDSSDREDQGVALPSGIETQGDSVTYTRSQEISFQNPVHLDTARARYLVPVGQVKLKESEIIHDNKDNLTYSSMSISKNGNRSYHQNISNNFIYIDQLLSMKKFIFDYPVAISNWSYLQNNGHAVILFQGTSTDDNEDKTMNDKDYQSLFAYYVEEDHLEAYHFNQQTVVTYKFMPKTNWVYVVLGEDKNQDFLFNPNEEPKTISILNVSTKTMMPMVSEATKSQLQAIVDGAIETVEQP